MDTDSILPSPEDGANIPDTTDTTGDLDNLDAPKLPETAEEALQDFNANLQEEIDRYKADMASLQEEFNEATDETSPDVTKKSLVRAAPAAVERIIILVSHADSESVQLSAAKYILDVALGKSKLEADADGFDKLINQLMAEKKETDAAKKNKKDSKG